MALTEIPFVLVGLAIIGANVCGLLVALRARDWIWAVVQVLVPGLATAVYLLVVRRSVADHSPDPRIRT